MDARKQNCYCSTQRGPRLAGQPKRKSPTDRKTQLLKLYPLGSSISWKKAFALFAKNTLVTHQSKLSSSQE
jgi:hypothetical protein